MPDSLKSANLFNSAQWLGWIIGVAVMTFTLMSFAYSQFETKEQAQERKDDMVKQLDRINQKLDSLLDNRAASRR